jgi:hypothetical protein
MDGAMTPAGTIHDRSDFVSVAEAARILQTSPATIKRRIKAGTLEAEQLQRPQGFEYRVRVQRDEPARASDDAAPSTDRSDSEWPTPSTGTMQDVSAAIAAATTPLMERLAVADATIAGQMALIRELERENGRLTSQVERLTTVQMQPALQDAKNGTLAAFTAPQPSNPTTEPHPLREPFPFPVPLPPSPPSPPWWRRWLSAVYGWGSNSSSV